MVRPSPADLALAALVGVLFGLSPITSAHRVIPSIAGGGFFGLVFLGYRAYLKRGDVSPHPAVALDPRLAVVPVLLAVLLAPAAAELYPWYTESIWRNAHGLLVPLLAFALARLILREDAGDPFRPSAWGFAVLVPGLLLLVVDTATRTLQLGVVGVVLIVAGTSLLLLGTRKTRRLAVPIALLLFLMPLPAALSSPLGLPTTSAAGTSWALQALGFPVLRDGVALILPDNMYNVTVRCSGFSTVYPAVAISLVLGVAGRSLPRTILMLASIWPLTWLANVVRSTALVAFCEARGIGLLDTALHGISGIAAFLGVIGCIVLIGGSTARRRLLT